MRQQLRRVADNVDKLRGDMSSLRDRVTRLGVVREPEWRRGLATYAFRG